MNETLRPAARGLTFKLPLELEYGADRAPFGEEQSVMAEQLIAQIGERVADVELNVAQFESLRSALNDYGAMLSETRTALAVLVEALERPQSFESISEQLFEIASSVKRHIAAFRAARVAAR